MIDDSSDVSVRFALAETEGDTPDGITVDRELSVAVDLAVRLDEVAPGWTVGVGSETSACFFIAELCRCAVTDDPIERVGEPAMFDISFSGTALD